MAKLKYPSWQAAYEEAFLEFNSQKIEKKMFAAESAIISRLQELANGENPGTDERAALNDALHALRGLQVEKLHYPTLPNESPRY